MKDIKNILKEAREAIKNKDYETALKHSKNVLREDKTNYMALVFMGLALQESGPKDQSPKAFKKAIEINPSNPLAWNGLISYYEKNNAAENQSALVDAYISILEIETAEKKLLEYADKLVNFAQENNISNICTSLYKTSKNENISGNIKYSLLERLAKLLNQKQHSSDLLELHENALKDLIQNPENSSTEYYQYYFKVLYKQNKIQEILDFLEPRLPENNAVCLNWACKIYSLCYIEQNEIGLKLRENIPTYLEKLMEQEPHNAYGFFVKSIILFEDGDITQARDNLINVLAQHPNLVHALVFLELLCVKLHLPEEAYNIYNRVENLLKPNSSNASLKNKQLILKLQILSYLPEECYWKEALNIFKTIDDQEIKLKCLESAIRSNINLNNFAECQLLLLDLKSFNEQRSLFMKSILLHKQQEYEKALEIIEPLQIDSSEYWLEIGSLYWDLKKYEKCLMPFLKAAKCDPNSYLCFLNLGNYYQHVGDTEKARRCYEKAFKINPKSAVTGTELSKIYRKQKNWEANLNLLNSIASDSISKNNLWAFLQLGLQHLEQQEYDKAIENLRLVLRIDRDNMHCWESLADAYFSRGAYTSALKCYQKASELSHDALYPALQQAHIKKILGENVGAMEDFVKILHNNGDYVPALQGMAETCMNLARQCYKDQRLGSARDHAQHASEHLTRAAQQRGELSCLWKLLGDSCFFVAKLPEKYSCLMISKTLLEGSTETTKEIVEKEDLYKLATRCYCKAVTLTEDNTFLWNDLGTCYLNHSLNTSEPELKENLVNYALAAAQHCTSSSPTNWKHWNLLGNVAMVLQNYSLAQHAFIKAVTADHNCAVAWANLGILYLIKEKIRLANKAFTQGQRSDPNYVNSWIGQGFIAELVSPDEAMDLFRHSTQLGQNQQGGIGYGHWVCEVLLSAAPGTVIYSIHNMHAIPVACDALTWYTEKNPYDGCAWNMLGILKERMGLKQGATQAFRNAYRYSEKDYRDKGRVNYGRLLSKTGKYEDAINMFQEVQEATFNSGSSLALAMFKDKKYKESYEAYEQALNWLTEEQTHQSDLLVALAAMAYMFQGPDAAKTLLFQSIQLKPASPWAFYATLSLGLLHNDAKLAKLVLDEMSYLKDKKDCLLHYSTLMSYVYLIRGEHVKAIREVSKLVHRHPEEAAVWWSLSLLLLYLQNETKSSKAIARCAQLAMRLGRSSMDVTKVQCVVSLGSTAIGNTKQALIAAQKAVHYYPDIADCRAALYSASVDKKQLGKVWKLQLLKKVQRSSASDKLTVWAKNQEVLVT